MAPPVVMVLVSARGWKRVVGDLILFAIACALSFSIWQGTVNSEKTLHHADHNACVRIEALKSLARTQLHRALASLPTLAYYRLHPAELASQSELIREQLHEFRPLPC